MHYYKMWSYISLNHKINQITHQLNTGVNVVFMPVDNCDSSIDYRDFSVGPQLDSTAYFSIDLEYKESDYFSGNLLSRG